MLIVKRTLLLRSKFTFSGSDGGASDSGNGILVSKATSNINLASDIDRSMEGSSHVTFCSGNLMKNTTFFYECSTGLSRVLHLGSSVIRHLEYSTFKLNGLRRCISVLAECSKYVFQFSSPWATRTCKSANSSLNLS